MRSDAERFVAEGARTLSNGDWIEYGDLFAEGLVMRTPGMPVTTGREARVELAKAITAPFPDGQVKVERIVSEGDWSCFQLRFTGTHTEPMPTPDGGTVPPTQRSVDLPYCIVARFEGGVVAELDEYYDRAEMANQLGIG